MRFVLYALECFVCFFYYVYTGFYSFVVYLSIEFCWIYNIDLNLLDLFDFIRHKHHISERELCIKHVVVGTGELTA